ncbi:hypothetical protein LSAT2_032107 [Lamellibrachia satsuma]|nr:hypothetical protein LSAT2_032107 [Lamellibrachia satsuma]
MLYDLLTFSKLTSTTNRIELTMSSGKRTFDRLSLLLLWVAIGASTAQTQNPCTNKPCVNGGTCIVLAVTSYTCDCLIDFTGTNCQIENRACRSNPCLNGATCRTNPTGFTCACAAGYSGIYCENDGLTQMVACNSNPCENNSNCTGLFHAFTCQCRTGFYGTTCSEVDECSSHPCSNGGGCTDRTNGYSCACLTGYAGATCQTDTDECASAPCHHGACTDGANGYRCACRPTYSGANCETKVRLAPFGCRTTLVPRLPQPPPSNYWSVDANLPRQLGSGFCRVILPLWVSGRSYDFSVEVMSVNGVFHPALMYNVHDDSNFDYLLVNGCRVPATCQANCSSPGYVVGDRRMTRDNAVTSCTGGVPSGQNWYQLRVEVRGYYANLFMADQLVGRVDIYHPAVGNVGVAALTGFNNVVAIRRFWLRQMPLSLGGSSTCLCFPLPDRSV